MKNNAINQYFRILLWPIVLLITLALFYQPLSRFIDRLVKVSFVKDGDETRFDMVANVAANLTAAELSRAGPTSNKENSIDLKASGHATSLGTGSLTVSSVDIGALAHTATHAAGLQTINSAKILWVDDNPDNNQYERNALSALGITFDLVPNTGEAVALMKTKKFNLVITDFERVDDPQAGYTLLTELKKTPSPPPLIIYSGSANSIFVEQARAKGAYGETNSPRELYDLAVNALLNK